MFIEGHVYVYIHISVSDFCMASVGPKYDAVVSFYVAADVSFRRTELISVFEK